MKTTEEKNRIIAEFMSGEVQPSTYNWDYHKDWDWLMPVVEKIESFLDQNGYHLIVKIEGTCCEILTESGFSFVNAVSNTKLEATYECVVALIDHWNNAPTGTWKTI